MFMLPLLSKVILTKMHILSWLQVRFSDVKFTIILDEGRSSFTRRNILDKNVFINDVQPFSASFSDSGIFGLKLAGSASHVILI